MHIASDVVYWATSVGVTITNRSVTNSANLMASIGGTSTFTVFSAFSPFSSCS